MFTINCFIVDYHMLILSTTIWLSIALCDYRWLHR